MDHFGIGHAMKAIATTYFRSSRATGRTYSLVQSVKDGDVICFANHKEAQRVMRMCGERGVHVSAIVVDPKSPDEIYHTKVPKGRLIFDHEWVEIFYLDSISRAANYIDSAQRICSPEIQDFSEARFAQQEGAKWE